MAIEKLKYIVTADTKGFSGPIKAIGALVVTAFVAAIKVTADFEKELSKLRAISGATSTEMVSLEKKARDLGKTTAFTAREVASLQTELAKLGFTTNDILNSSGGVLDLAAGLGTTLADAAVLTGSTLRAFGLSTEETGRVVDVLAKSASSSALDFEKLTESLKIAAPIAKATGTSIEETVAILGTLADAGIHGSIAGTSFRKTMIELNAAGLSLNDAYKLVNGSSNKLATATDLVGKRAASAFLVMASGATQTDALTVALQNAEGAAEEMRKIMEDNLIGDFDKLKSAVTELGIAMGQTTDGPMRLFIQTLTDGINNIGDPLRGIALKFLDIRESILEAALAFQDFLGILGSPKEIARLEQALRDVTKKQVDLTSELFQTGTGGFFQQNDGGKSKEKPLKGTTPGGGGGGGGGGDDFTSKFGLLAFSESGFFDGALENITGFTTKAESMFTSMATNIKAVSKDTTDSLAIGWEFVGGAIAGALATAAGGDASFGDIAAGLLRGIGAALIGIGVAAVIAGKALAIFGVGIPAIYHGYIAIAAGAVLVAGGSLIGGKAGAGGGGGSGASRGSGAAASSAGTFTPTSTQGGGSGGSQIVGIVRGQDLVLQLQAANRIRPGLT